MTLRGTDRNKLRIQIQQSGKRYYTYVLHRTDKLKLEPFYVGYGQNQRFSDHEDEAKNSQYRTHKANIIRLLKREGLPILYEIESFFDDVTAARQHERLLISRHGRYDLGRGTLTNLTNGGDGPQEWSDDTRLRHLETLGGTEGDSDRAALNRMFRKFGNAASVAIKLLDKRQIRDDFIGSHDRHMDPSSRMCAALACSAMANGVLLAPRCQIPRQFEYEGISGIIEWGSSRDMVTADMIEVLSVAPRGHEIYQLTEVGFRSMLAKLTETKLTSAGIFLLELHNVEAWRQQRRKAGLSK